MENNFKFEEIYRYEQRGEIVLPFNILNDSEYVPVASIYNIRNHHSIKKLLSNYDYDISANIIIGVDPIQKIIKHLSNPISMFNPTKHSTSRSLSRITSGYSTTYKIKAGRNLYISYLNTVMHYDSISNIYTPLYMMVCKRDDIEYIKKCILLDREVHPDAVKLLVNDEFDVVRSRFSSIRPHYRRNLKNKLLKAGIEIENVSNFNNIFNVIKKPKALSINGYKDKMNEIAKDFLSSNKELEDNKVDGFEITF